MSSEYTYKITPLAVEDIDDSLRYISENLHNQTAANNLYADIITAIENACSFPTAYSNCEEYNIQDKNIRKIIVNNYILIYEIARETKQIHILRFRYGKMNLPNMEITKGAVSKVKK